MSLKCVHVFENFMTWQPLKPIDYSHKDIPFSDLFRFAVCKSEHTFSEQRCMNLEKYLALKSSGGQCLDRSQRVKYRVALCC